jgi:ATP-dependent RNA helicase SUPV3L1/SUV3
MSVVGCSGEEFASILKALGFRRERRKVEPATDQDAVSVSQAEVAGEQQAAAVQPEAELFDEIWRPAKRKEMHHAKGAGHKPKHQHRGRAATSKREHGRPAAHAKPERTKSVEHSPFAALAVLKGRLTVRQPEGS